jgi:hypothetical protein
MPVVCPHCHATVPEQNVDRTRDIATCQGCGRLLDLRAQAPRQGREPSANAQAPSPAARLRPPVALPPGMTIADDSADAPFGYRSHAPSGVVITRRWLRKKHFVMLVVFAAAAAGLVYLWTTSEISAWLVIGTLMVASWNYMLLSMFLNKTTVRAGGGAGGRIEVRHGPLPHPVFRHQSVAAADVSQLYAVREGSLFAVGADLKNGSKLTLVRPLVTADQAVFVEQQLERVIGLVDFEVPGEISFPAGVPGPGAKAASVGWAAAALGPVIAIGAVGLVFVITRTEVSGTLSAGGPLGTWEFAADDCRSGQLDGFFGVTLTAKNGAGRHIRLAADTVRGNLAIVEQPGATPARTVIEGSSCRRFDLTVTRTSTTINDVRALDGYALLDCDGLSGTVSFEGCH